LPAPPIEKPTAGIEWNANGGRVVKLVYTRHLKCLGASHAGSNPVSPTKLSQ
jgi:hypothetical protein